MSTRRQRRDYQRTALAAIRKVRQLALYWARRCRKSTTLGEIGFDEMSVEAGRTVIAASASLLLGRELVGMTMSAAEQAMVVAQEAAAVRQVFDAGAAEKDLAFKVADSNKDKILNGLTEQDFAELYHSSRMELRLYFDRTHFSRLQIIAPNPATARSWRATVLRDEAGFTPAAFENELRIATDPMMRDTADLKIIYASNLSTNDRHPYYEMTMPRDIHAETEDAEFPAKPDGHLYVGQQGIVVHRVALKDAYAAGHKLFDDDGRAMTYEQCQAFPQFRLGWDGTYSLNHKAGGASVIDLIALINAQRKGATGCSFMFVENDSDFRRACDLLRGNLRGGRVGVGMDVASTTGETSNPSSVTVMEQQGNERFERLVVLWKEKKGVVARERLRRLFDVIRNREQGGPAVRFCIDASNERLFAEETSDELRGIVPVQLVIAGESVEPLPPGYRSAINYKTFEGDLYATAINDGSVAVPADKYIKEDHRMVIKDGGRYVCVPDADGKHGDTFDSGKHALLALNPVDAVVGAYLV